jgi:hypothetical protein
MSAASLRCQLDNDCSTSASPPHSSSVGSAANDPWRRGAYALVFLLACALAALLYTNGHASSMGGGVDSDPLFQPF